MKRCEPMDVLVFSMFFCLKNLHVQTFNMLLNLLILLFLSLLLLYIHYIHIIYTSYTSTLCLVKRNNDVFFTPKPCPHCKPANPPRHRQMHVGLSMLRSVPQLQPEVANLWWVPTIIGKMVGKPLGWGPLNNRGPKKTPYITWV